MKYQLMKYRDIEQYIPDMEAYKVSEIARGPEGFLTYYKNNPKLNKFWDLKRRLFLDRTIPAYLKNPTLRRKLSLYAWAYDIDKYYS